MFTARTLMEAKWPLATTLILLVATVAWCPWRWVALLPALALGFVLWFFRDPPRVSPADPSLIVAPADGRIVEIQPAREDVFLQTDAIRVAIFMSVWDVHVQRAPIAGTIRRVQYQPGRFHDVRQPAASANENRTIGLETTDGFRVVVRQVAGLIARRIVGWVGEGAVVNKGDRIGMIRFGSRVELFLPMGKVEVLSRVGDVATGGETILARRR